MKLRIVSFLAGFATMAVFSGIALNLVDSGWRRTVDNYKKEERILLDRIELRDQRDRENAGVETLLVDRQGGSQYVWVIPGRVVPHTADGRLGTVYGYLDHAGHVAMWYQPESEIRASTINPENLPWANPILIPIPKSDQTVPAGKQWTPTPETLDLIRRFLEGKPQR